VPPVMATARALAGETPPAVARLALLTVWALAWLTAALAGYAQVRRSRS
jgi:hypothetical protein